MKVQTVVKQDDSVYIAVSLGNMEHYPDKPTQVCNLNVCSSIPRKVLRIPFVPNFRNYL